jgi:DeoR family transcriptional regulator, fructose operon transcriptional repressor
MSTTGPMYSEERRQRIVALINERKKLTVKVLCELLGVSPATVRADLRDLDREGLLVRTHGGAIERSKTGFEQVSRNRVTENLEAKRAIAALADALVEDGDTILLDTGTTTIELARRLQSRRDLTVVTNDLEIALVLEEAAGVQVVLLGGALRKGYHCTVGSAGLQMAQNLRVDKAFVATNSLSFEAGATTPDLQQAETKKAMLAIAKKSFVLCDSSKIGRSSFVRFADLDRIDVIITERISTADRARFEKSGVEVVVPENDG